MDFKDYPFVKCLHPLHIVNPNTGNDMLVGCGACDACVLNRYNKMVYLCQQEELCCKYCYFVTLTYNNDYLPLAMPIIDEFTGHWKFHTYCQRHRDFIDITEPDNYNYEIASYSAFDYSLTKMDNLLYKINQNGCVSYPFYRDLQLYIKRVRKLYGKYEKEEPLRFYAVSEYGPKHFRSHFHVLFFSNSDKFHHSWQEVIHSSWSFGFVKSSLSRGKVAGYCSSYVNSSTTLPRIFTTGCLRPRVSHSRYFGFNFSKQKYDEYYQLPLERFVKEVRRVADGVAHVCPVSAYTSAVFPRCKAYFSKSPSQLFRTYTILRQAERDYGKDSISNLAEIICKDMFNNGFSETCKYFNDSNFQLISKLRFDYDIEKFDTSTLVRQKITDSIYRELFISRKFIRDICHDDEDLFYSRFKRIVDFYNYKALIQLKEFYTKQQEFIDRFPEYKYHCCHFYDNFYELQYVPDIGVKRFIPDRSLRMYIQLGGIEDEGTFENKINLESNKLYSAFKYNVNKKLKDKIKHKIQNELNNKYL